MSNVKSFRYTVGMLGFLGIGLYLVLATFGQFSVSEMGTLTGYPAICSGIVYIFTIIIALWVNIILTSDESSDDLEAASLGIVFYVIFLAVEWLSYGAPMRGILHGLLPVLGLLVPAVVNLITYQRK